MTLLIKFPTRGRPDQFFTVLQSYYDLATGGDIHFVITCDADDESMNNAAVIDRLQTFKNLEFYFGTSESKIQAVNADIKNHAFDILLVASDDMVPVVEGYDQIILKKMNQHFPDKDGVLWFYDGVTRALDTLPILGVEYYNRFGYVYHPDYTSFWADKEFQDVAKAQKKLVYFDQCIIEHRHPSSLNANWDATYERNQYNSSVDLMSADDIVYRRRKQSGFPYISTAGHVCHVKPLQKKLSLLICSMETRQWFRERLLNCLQPQLTDDVELLVSIDPGDSTVGQMRNELLAQSNGDYVAFIDDDDLVASDYVSRILDAICESPDVVGFGIVMTTDGMNPMRAYISNRYKTWSDQADPFCDGRRVYFRCPNHLSPVKRELALKVAFPHLSSTEDRVFSFKLAQFLKSERYIESPMYYYLRRTDKSSSEENWVLQDKTARQTLREELDGSTEQTEMMRRLRSDTSSRDCRKQIWQSCKSKGQSIEQEIEPGVRMRLYTDSELDRAIYVGEREVGDYEKSERLFLNQFMRQGDTFIDVGANNGLFTLIAARLVGDTGHVYAFEPCAKSYERLLANLALNQCQNASTYKIALSDKAGPLTITTSLDGWDACNSFVQPTTGKVFGTEQVHCTTLDEFVAEHNLGVTVTMVKIDVEGWELAVISGARRLLSGEHTPILQVEFTAGACRNAGHSCSDLFYALQDFGFSLFSYSAPARTLIYEPTPQEYAYKNLFAFKTKDMSCLLSRGFKLGRFRSGGAKIPSLTESIDTQKSQ